MAIAGYDKYDGLGLAELVRNKQAVAAELLDEAIARTDRVDPQSTRGREPRRPCAAPDRPGTA